MYVCSVYTRSFSRPDWIKSFAKFPTTQNPNRHTNITAAKLCYLCANSSPHSFVSSKQCSRWFFEQILKFERLMYTICTYVSVQQTILEHTYQWTKLYTLCTPRNQTNNSGVLEESTVDMFKHVPNDFRTPNCMNFFGTYLTQERFLIYTNLAQVQILKILQFIISSYIRIVSIPHWSTKLTRLFGIRTSPHWIREQTFKFRIGSNS